MSMKISFIFEAGTAGWSEVWYSALTNVPDVMGRLTRPFWQQFFAPRGVTPTLVAVRVSNVQQPRNAQVIPLVHYRQELGLTTDVGDENPQTAMMISTRLVPLGRRTILLRGIKDIRYAHSPGGAFRPNGTMIQDMNLYIQAVNVIGGLQTNCLLAATGPNPDRPIASLSPADTSGAATLVTYTGTAPIVGSRVIFHKLPFNEFPGLRGVHTVIGLQTNAFVVPVRYTAPVFPFTVTGASWRIVETELRPIQDFFLRDIREKKVGRPFDLLAGRRRGIRYAPR